jgi:hypothetical protein
MGRNWPIAGSARPKRRTYVSATGTPAAYSEPTSAAAPRDKAIAALAVVTLLISMPVGWLTDNPSNGDRIGMAVAILINLGVLAAMFLWLIPRERAASTRTARTAMIVGIVAFLLCGVFWTGLPQSIGAGAVALGLALRSSGETNRKATAGLVLGAIAMLASFVLLLIG